MTKIVLLIAACFAYLNSPAQQNQSLQKPIELTYFHKVSFPELYQAGVKHRFVQLCTMEVDSVIDGKVNFNKASIASIKTCTLSMFIAADTIRTYEVKTIGQKNTKRLLKETIKFYGQPAETKGESGKMIYSWKKSFGNGQYVVSVLTLEAKNSSGFLLSKID
jgi:hypothetical protein